MTLDEAKKDFLSTYGNAMDYLKLSNKNTFNLFNRWYKVTGKDLLKLVENLCDVNSISLLNTYGKWLEMAMRENNLPTILEFLYNIPSDILTGLDVNMHNI